MVLDADAFYVLLARLEKIEIKLLGIVVAKDLVQDPSLLRSILK